MTSMNQPTGPTCSCGELATHQSARDASDEEFAAYRQSLNDHRASLGFEPFPENSAIMTHPATIAEYHCCDHRPDDHAPCEGCPTEAPADTPPPTGP